MFVISICSKLSQLDNEFVTFFRMTIMLLNVVIKVQNIRTMEKIQTLKSIEGHSLILSVDLATGIITISVVGVGYCLLS